MRSKIKALAGVLSVAMMVTGCSSAASSSSASSSSSAATGSSSATVASSSESASEEGTSSFRAEKEMTLTVFTTESSNQPIKDMAVAQQEILEKTNVKIEFEIGNDDKRSLLLATNNIPDIMRIPTADLTEYGPTGIFLNVSDYMAQGKMPNLQKFYDEIPNLKKREVDGVLWGCPQIARDEAANGFGPILRVDLLEKNNIETPQTFDELLEAMQKLKEIYPDSKPWTGRKGTSQMLKTISYMLGSGYGNNGLYYDYDLEKYVFGPATQEFKAVLEYLNKAYTTGVLDPDYATTTGDTLSAQMSSGQSFMFIDNSGFGQNYTPNLKKTDPEGKLQIIPIPENSFGQRRAVLYETVLPGDFFAVNAKVDDPDTVMAFMDWLYSQEGSDITNYGKEGLSFEYDENGEPHFIQDYVMQFKDAQPTCYYAVYSELGITKLNFSLWAANTKTTFEIEKLTGIWSDLTDEYWSIVESDDAYVTPIIDPALTAEENERVKDLTANLTTMLEQEYDKYIMGLEPIENYDNVIAKAIEMGAEEIAEIYNTANAR